MHDHGGGGGGGFDSGGGGFSGGGSGSGHHHHQHHDGGFGSPGGGFGSPGLLQPGRFTNERRPGLRNPGQRPRRAERFALRLVFFAVLAFMIYVFWPIATFHS